MEETRYAALRRQNRRVFAWSLAIAIAVHVVVLVFVVWPQAQPNVGGGTELVDGASTDWRGTPVRAFFGSPVIAGPDGSLLPEGPNRVLSAERRLTLGSDCWSGLPQDGEGAVGEVYLMVNGRGRVDSVQVTRSSGSRCWDRALASIAGDLWYRWLPTELFPAPVRLYQPVSLSLAGY